MSVYTVRVPRRRESISNGRFQPRKADNRGQPGVESAEALEFQRQAPAVNALSQSVSTPRNLSKRFRAVFPAVGRTAEHCSRINPNLLTPK